MAKNDFRVTSIFKIIIRIFMKNVGFCRKTYTFLPKICLFIFCIFYLNEKELNQQICLIKYVENEISNSNSLTKKKEEEQKHNPTSKIFLKLLKNFHWLHQLLIITNSQIITVTTCGQTLKQFEKQKFVLNFEYCYCYFK